MTVAELLAAGSAQLPSSEGLPDPGHEARWLLGALLAVSETWLLAHGDDEIGELVSERFTAWIERRRSGEPAHYISGECGFYGREFRVGPGVLIPRPETELLVDAARALALPTAPKVLDVGTGSGCLAVTLALELAGAEVVATELSTAAAAIAKINAARFGARVRVVASDLVGAIRGSFDLVVANLPYVPDAELASLAVEIRKHEPRVALAGGNDGLDVVRRLLAELPRIVEPSGAVLLELGPGQASVVSEWLGNAGFTEQKRVADLGGVERILVAVKRI